jgi:hypothetical protein
VILYGSRVRSAGLLLYPSTTGVAPREVMRFRVPSSVFPTLAHGFCLRVRAHLLILEPQSAIR